MKKYFKKLIAFSLLIIMTCMEASPMISHAVTPGTDTGEIDTPKPNGPITEYDTSIVDAYVEQRDLGVRIYVTDAYGNVKQTEDRYDAIDYIYRENENVINGAKEKGYKKNHYLRCTNNAKGNYNIKQFKYMDDLGFTEIYEKYCPIANRFATECIHQKEYFVDRFRHASNGPQRHVLRINLFDIDQNAEPRALKILTKEWASTIKIYEDNKKAALEANLPLSEEDELYMHCEILMTIVHHTTSPNAATWHGTIFEFGCHTESERKALIYKSKYLSYGNDYCRFVPQAFYISNNFNCFNNLPYMGAAYHVNRDLKPNEIETKAYGMYSMSFRSIVQPENKTEETEIPTEDNVEVKKEEDKIIEKVEKIDNVEIRTGYAAQEGYYDIGVNAGIPTTEIIRNVTEYQDCIINYGYIYEKYDTSIKVTYELSYYVPCTCKKTCEHTTSHDAEYDKDGNKIKDAYTEYEHEDGDVGYHGDKYHTEKLKIDGKLPSVTIPRSASYYRITDYMIYGAETVSIMNECGNASYYGLSPISNVTAIISGVENPNDIDNVALDTHLDYTGIQDKTFKHTDVNGGVFSSESAAKNWFEQMEMEHTIYHRFAETDYSLIVLG